MEWKGLDLHIENLVPGIVVVLLLLGFVPTAAIDGLRASLLFQAIQNNVVASAGFIAVSYLVGILAVAVSRFLLDRISEAVLRPVLIRRLSRPPLSGRSWAAANQLYRQTIAQTLSGSNDVIKAEVLRRRERGRLVRTSLIPTLLLGVQFGGPAVWTRTLWALFGAAAVLGLYAYVEFTIYEECLLGISPSGTPNSAVAADAAKAPRG